MTLGNVRNPRSGLDVKVGDVLVVGNEDAEPGVGEIVELGERGVVLVRVFPGSVAENRHRLPTGPGSPG